MKDEVKAEQLFQQIVSITPHATIGRVFGAMSIKCINGKNAAFLWKSCMVFKLDETTQKEALNIPGAKVGAHLYAPDRPMKGWVSIPENQSAQWAYFATKAHTFVSNKR